MSKSAAIFDLKTLSVKALIRAFATVAEEEKDALSKTSNNNSLTMFNALNGELTTLSSEIKSVEEKIGQINLEELNGRFKTIASFIEKVQNEEITSANFSSPENFKAAIAKHIVEKLSLRTPQKKDSQEVLEEISKPSFDAEDLLKTAEVFAQMPFTPQSVTDGKKVQNTRDPMLAVKKNIKQRIGDLFSEIQSLNNGNQSLLESLTELKSAPEKSNQEILEKIKKYTEVLTASRKTVGEMLEQASISKQADDSVISPTQEISPSEDLNSKPEVEDSHPALQKVQKEFPKTYEKISALVASLGGGEEARKNVLEVLGFTNQKTAPNGDVIYSNSAPEFSDDETVAESLGLLSNGVVVGKYSPEDDDLKAEENPKFDPKKFLPQISASTLSLAKNTAFKNLVTQLGEDIAGMGAKREKDFRKTLAQHSAEAFSLEEKIKAMKSEIQTQDQPGAVEKLQKDLDVLENNLQKSDAKGLELKMRSLAPIEQHMTKMLGSFSAHGFGMNKDDAQAFGLCLESVPTFTAEVRLYAAAQAAHAGFDDPAKEISQNALRSYEEAAKQGDQKAALALGYIHSLGCAGMEVEPNPMRAEEYFRSGGETLSKELKTLKTLQETKPSNFLSRLVNALVSAVKSLFGINEITREMSPKEIAASDALRAVEGTLARGKILSDPTKETAALYANPQRTEINRSLQNMLEQHHGQDLVDEVNRFFFKKTDSNEVVLEEVGHGGSIGSIKGDALEALQTILFSASHSHYDSGKLPKFYEATIEEFSKVLVDPVDGKTELQNLGTVLKNLQEKFPDMKNCVEAGKDTIIDKLENNQFQPGFTKIAVDKATAENFSKLFEKQVEPAVENSAENSSSAAELPKNNGSWVERLNLSKRASGQSHVEMLEKAGDGQRSL